jgi:hypothetical protein
MKLKIVILVMVLFLFLSYLSPSMHDTCTAEEADYKISVTNTDYEHLKTEGSGNQVFTYYKVIITLHNSGNIESDDITVSIWEANEDKKMAIHRNAIIPSGETKKFIFGEDDGEWIVQGASGHIVFFEYHPTNTSLTNNQNSGSGTFKLQDNSASATTNTPGFELILIIISTAAIFLLKKRKLKI